VRKVRPVERANQAQGQLRFYGTGFPVLPSFTKDQAKDRAKDQAKRRRMLIGGQSGRRTAARGASQAAVLH
jgi:hypothetical protein